MTQYYFIGTALPTLAIGVKPELPFKELLQMLRENLTASDWEKVEDLLWPVDIANIRSLWMGLPFDEKGLHTPKELEEALLVRDGFPDYLNDFLDRYESTADRLKFFPSLFASMYRAMEKKSRKGFIKYYYTLERELRLVLTALRAKQAGRDLARELQFEDLTDPFVMAILAQKDSTQYVPPPEYEEVKLLFQKYSQEPKQLHRALLEYRFNKYDLLEPFSIDRILSYTIQLMIVESWEGLNQNSGKTIVEDLSKHG
jgi:hypothetical protein